MIHRSSLVSSRYWLQALKKLCAIDELPLWIDDYSQCIVTRYGKN